VCVAEHLFLRYLKPSERYLSGLTLPLLELLKRLRGAVESMSVVSSELGVGSVQAGVTEGLRLLDAVPVGLLVLVVLGGVLGFGHGEFRLSVVGQKRVG